MDPITAIGLAGNVVQFVDFGFKLISNGVELYRNSTLIEHAQLRDQARQLKDFNAILTSRLDGVHRPDRSWTLRKVLRSNWANARDEDLKLLDEPLVKLLRAAVEHCDLCATQVVDAVSKLTVSGSNAKWQSFRHALRSTIGDSGLSTANDRLAKAQQNVTLFLVLYTRYVASLLHAL